MKNKYFLLVLLISFFVNLGFAEKISIEYKDSNAGKIEISGDFTKWKFFEMEKNGDIFKFETDIPEGKYYYNLRIDGKVQVDKNKEIEKDLYGQEYSVLIVGDEYKESYKKYKIDKEKLIKIAKDNEASEYIFKYKNPNAMEVFLAGDFNGWNETGTPMEKGMDGNWQAAVNLAPGEYEYKYIVDGQWIKDPDNSNVRGDYENSVLVIEGGKTKKKINTSNIVKEDGEAVFIYKDPEAESVFIAGSFNDWNPESDKMKKTGDMFKISLDLEPGDYQYKFVVDGEWKADPENPNTAEDGFGGTNSVIIIDKQKSSKIQSGDSEFVYKDSSADEVFIAGSFNDWNPESDKMEKTGDLFKISLDLEPGEYQYKFVVDGEWKADPENPNTAEDGFGGTNSVIIIDKQKSSKIQSGDSEFVYKDSSADEVFIAGSFNDWNPESDKMEKTGDLFKISLDLEPGEYQYKFVVDGEWKADPENPNTAEDGFGGTNSVVKIEKKDRETLSAAEVDVKNIDKTTVIGNMVIFVYKGDAETVFLSGDFNNWNPEAEKMNTQNDKHYLIKTLKPGKYMYKYVADGNWIQDETNPNEADDGYGGKNSLVVIGKSKSQIPVKTKQKNFGSNKITHSENGEVVFVYFNPSASNVSVAGSFNDWKANDIVLHKDDEGYWKGSAKLKQGNYEYKFVVDDQWIADSNNPDVSGEYGNSVLKIGQNGKILNDFKEEKFKPNSDLSSIIKFSGIYKIELDNSDNVEDSDLWELEKPAHDFFLQIYAKIAYGLSLKTNLRLSTTQDSEIYDLKLRLYDTIIKMENNIVNLTGVHNKAYFTSFNTDLFDQKVLGTKDETIKLGKGISGIEAVTDFYSESFKMKLFYGYLYNSYMLHTDSSSIHDIERLKNEFHPGMLYRSQYYDINLKEKNYDYDPSIIGGELQYDVRNNLVLGLGVKYFRNDSWNAKTEYSNYYLQEYLSSSAQDSSDWFQFGTSEILAETFINSVFNFGNFKNKLRLNFGYYYYKGDWLAGNKTTNGDSNGRIDGYSFGKEDGFHLNLRYDINFSNDFGFGIKFENWTFNKMDENDLVVWYETEKSVINDANLPKMTRNDFSLFFNYYSPYIFDFKGSISIINNKFDHETEYARDIFCTNLFFQRDFFSKSLNFSLNTDITNVDENDLFNFDVFEIIPALSYKLSSSLEFPMNLRIFNYYLKYEDLEIADIYDAEDTYYSFFGGLKYNIRKNIYLFIGYGVDPESSIYNDGDWLKNGRREYIVENIAEDEMGNKNYLTGEEILEERNVISIKGVMQF